MLGLKNRHVRVYVSALTLVLLIAVASPFAQAQTDRWWIGGDGNWNVDANWQDLGTNPGVPQAGDTAILGQGVFTVQYDAPADPGLSYLYVENGMTLSLSANVLSTGEEHINWGGVHVQSGGTHTIGTYLMMGKDAGSVGSYELSGSTVLNKTTHEEIIGDNGEGYFFQSGGTHTFAGAMYLGAGSGYGRYEMTDGLLNNPVGQDGGIALGEWGGTGEFFQWGGTVQVSDLTLARQEGSSGYYELDSLFGPAVLETGWVDVGKRGQGHFVHASGEHTVSFNLTVGIEPTGDGIYDLQGDSVLEVHGSTAIGLAGTGTFNQYDSSSHTVHNDLRVDALADSKGVYNLWNGTLQVDHMAYVGNNIGATGEVNQYGGEANVDEGLILGVTESSSGKYVMDDGALTTGWTHVGSAGTGTFSHSGFWTTGTHATDTLILGVAATGHGEYYLYSGAMLTNNLCIVGDAGYGYFEHHNGAKHYANGDVILGNQPTGEGYYTMESVDLDVLGSIYSGMQGYGEFDHSAECVVTVQGDLFVGTCAGSEGYYDLRGGPAHLNVIGNTYVGEHGLGSLNNYGGRHYTSDLLIGSHADGNGHYVMDNDAWLGVTGNTIVGRLGVGHFEQYSGTHEAQALYVAGDPGGDYGLSSTGVYDMGGGELATALTVVGQEGTGVFNHDSGNGGVHRTGSLWLGNSGSGAGNGSGTYNLGEWSELHTNHTVVGLFGFGEFNQTGGLHEVTANLVVGDGPETPPAGPLPTRQGIYNLSGGSSVLSVGGDTIVGNGNDGFDGEPGGKGTFTHTGGAHTTGFLIIGAIGAKGTGTGLYDLQDGALVAGDIVINKGAFNYSGGTLEVVGGGVLENHDQFNVSGGGTRTVKGNVVNYGTVKTSGTTVVWDGTYTENAQYISDPSVNVFEDDLTVEATGAFVGGAGDEFHMKESLINRSLQNTAWDTFEAMLTFVAGADNAHDLCLPGEDMGMTMDGYVDNFAWGTLRLDSGQTLGLCDSDLVPGAALYVGVLNLPDGISQIDSITGNGCNIYYDPTIPENAYLGGATYPLPGGGAVAPAPEPGTVALMLAGLGLAGLLRRRRRMTT